MRRLAVLAVLACVPSCGIEPPPKPQAGSASEAHAATRAPEILPLSQDPWAHAGWVRPLPPDVSLPGAAAAKAATATATAPLPTLTDKLPANLAAILHAPAEDAIVATHGTTIRDVAGCEDGSAAVTVDIAGSVRLWPKLDGTQEPVVVAMRPPASLAIQHVGTDVVIAGLDGAGQLELVRTAALGQPRSRTPVALARPAISIHATPDVFLVERDDQRIVLVDMFGHVKAELEPAAGERIAAVDTRGGAALALVETAGEVRGHWIDLANGRWGDETPELPVRAGAFALASNHRKIAAVHRTRSSSWLTIVDLVSGERLENGPDLGFIDPDLAPLAFLDADTLLVRESGEVMLWHAGRVADDGAMTSLAGGRRDAPPAAAGRQALIAQSGELMLVDAEGTVHYLGFRLPALTGLVPSGKSLLATDGQTILRIGTDLRDRTAYAIDDPHGPTYHVSTLLDGNHVLVRTYGKETYLDVIALDTQDVMPITDDDQLVAYDATSRLAAFTKGVTLRFRRFDPKTSTFGPPAVLDPGGSVSSTVFAERAHGVAAVVTVYKSGTYTQIDLTDIRPGDDKRPYRIARKKQGEPTFVGEGEVPPAADLGEVVLRRKSPDGTLSAELAHGRIVLHESDGRVRWAVPAHGALDLVWSAGGELIAFGGGAARVSVATGELLDQRCGWRFGLWQEPVGMLGASAMCEPE